MVSSSSVRDDGSESPRRASVAARRAYAGRIGSPPRSDWTFLGGPAPEANRQLVQEGFRVTAGPAPADPDADVAYQEDHSPRLALVGPKARARATQEATDPGATARLRSDLEQVLP